VRRALAIVALLAACGAFVVLTTGASDKGSSDSPKYKVELESAFGLTEGSDFKVAGTRAGKITSLGIDKRTLHALVGVQITEPSFGHLRTDASCESRPQSLIGEYFLDCQPGRGPRLAPGSTIPIRHTFSTIGPDLVNDILRLPQKERLRIILTELGAGVAGRGDDLNETLRRAVPALRDTDHLLAILASESNTIRDLTVNGDKVITALADNKRDVGRFVGEARDTAVASAERRSAIAATFHKFPGFLAELRPTMLQLGRVADGQTPALRDLDASAGRIKTFFNDLTPFSNASRVSLRTLADTAKTGRQAVTYGRPLVRQLRSFVAHTPELGKNLAIVLEDLDNRNRAIEPDPRSPGGKGFTGLEGLLMYAFRQTQAVNSFDANGHILKTVLVDSPCGAYADGANVKAHPERVKQCGSYLGPSQPGINQPDPTAGGAAARSKAAQKKADQETNTVREAVTKALAPQPAAPGAPKRKPVIDLKKTIQQLLGKTPDVHKVVKDLPKTLSDLGIPVNGPDGRPLVKADQQALVDYLLAP
jgi:ABC-type transporter Mla subunit MlaD